MIISANDTNDFVTIISSLSDNNPFACRIISLYNSYKPELAFVDYWLILNDKSGKCSGAIARSGSSFILFLTDNSELDEVSSFMRIAGATSVLCDAEYNLELFGSTSSTGSVLMKNTLSDTIANKNKFCLPDIKTVYELLIKCADDNFKPPAFEDFYVDVNHKLRHNAMRICGISDGENLAAVAMTVAESKNGAVLGAVACAPEYRKHGYGSSVVNYLSDMLISENKTVYLHRAENANINFYSSLGFIEVGKWKEYNFE